MQFLADNLISIMVIIIFSGWLHDMYVAYFKQGNKMTDEQLIEAYIALERKRK